MLRVSYISPSFYPAIKYGGPIYSTLHTCEELTKLNIKVLVSTTNTHVNAKLDVKTGVFTELLPNLYVKYYNETIVGQLSIPLFLNLWRDIKGSDIVHIQAVFNSPVPIALFYAKLFRKPVFYTPRGALAGWGLAAKKSIFKKLWLFFLIKPFVKNIIWHATSEAEKNDILAYFPNAKIVVIPNGVNLAKIEPVQLSRTDYALKYAKMSSSFSPIVVSMGRIHHVKGFDILIKCFALIRKLYPSVALFIAGSDDGELNNLTKLCTELELQNSVFFTGNIEGADKTTFLANADVFVLPSHTENFGLVYAEALAVGTPIVASTNTPWEEVEVAGCGRWVPNTVEDTANAMLDLLCRDREQLRQNALQYVQKFDWKNIALQFKELYEKTVQTKTKR